MEAPQIGKAQKVGTIGLIVKRKDGPLNRRVTMGAVLGLLNIYCTHWKNGQPLPNGLVEDELFGSSKERLDPYTNSNGRYTNQFLEMILENHKIPYKYTSSFDQPFIYFLETCLASKGTPKLNTPLHKIINNKICKAINKRGFLVLYDSEGCQNHSTLMYNELRNIPLNKDRVICVGAAIQQDTRLRSFFVSHLGEALYNSFVRNKGKTIKLVNSIRSITPDKNFTCLVGRGDSSHKAFLAKKLFMNNLVNDCHFSLTLLYRKSYKKIIPKHLVDNLPIYADSDVPDKNIVYDLSWAQQSHLLLSAKSFVNIIPTSTWRLEKQQAPEGRLPNDFFISIVTKRPFLVISNYANYLDTIRSLGYKTFDGILDESYDVEPNLLKRIDLVIEQMKSLNNQDLATLLHKCEDVFNHNLKVFMTKRTSQPFVDYLQSLSLYT